MLESHVTEDAIRRSTRTFALIYATGTLVALIGWYFITGNPDPHWYLTVGASWVFLLLVLSIRKIPPAVCTALLLICTALILFSASTDTAKMATSGRCTLMAPFVGHKILLLATALIVPFPLWTSYLIMAASALIPVIQIFSSPAAIRLGYTEVEPWVTLIYACFAVFVLRYRILAMARDRELAQVTIKRQKLKDLAQIFLTLRDLTNTPLQSIELCAFLLESDEIKAHEAARLIRTSLTQLKELSHLLSKYEKEVDWSTNDSTSGLAELLEQLENPSS